MKGFNNIMELRAITELFNKNYFIPEYQRGYRWESKQVEQLLEDLQEYFTNNDDTSRFYCLQPIIVKKCNDDIIAANNLHSDLDNNIWYEVIDGQQRLTTVRIICTILESAITYQDPSLFNIHYATRPEIDSIYESLTFNKDNADKALIDLRNTYRNIDSAYIYNAEDVIVRWFKEDKKRIGLFQSFFYNESTDKKSVQVVWYEDCGNEDARDLFKKINDLSVKLSCSELIRSLFLSSGTEYKCEIDLHDVDPNIKKIIEQRYKEEKQRYINTKWDEIEHCLSDEEMLKFIVSRNVDGIRNKIEVLFDLISKKYSQNKIENKDPLYTFLFFNKMIKEEGAWVSWKKVEEYYSRLCMWRKDRKYYHMIGYLNAVNDNDYTLIELLDFAKEHKKTELNGYLTEKIKGNIEDVRDIDLYNLDYRDPRNYYCIKKLLLLYSVELHHKNESLGYFPFYKFKPLSDWTLEHIHAQNSECLPPDDRAVWIQWSRDNADTLNLLRFENDSIEEEREQLVQDLNEAVKGFENKENGYTHIKVIGLFNRVTNLYAKADRDKTDMETNAEHQLSNMALLRTDTNSSIGCSAFAVKRNKILELYNNNTYFPIGTINVFGKMVGTSQQVYEWSHSDREAYMASLKEVLSDYINFD